MIWRGVVDKGEESLEDRLGGWFLGAAGDWKSQYRDHQEWHIAWIREVAPCHQSDAEVSLCGLDQE